MVSRVPAHHMTNILPPNTRSHRIVLDTKLHSLTADFHADKVKTTVKLLVKHNIIITQ